MLFVFFLSTLVALSFGAKDPTKVCLPDVFQTVIYSFTNELSGVLVYDFPNHKLGVRYTNGLRQVFTLNDLSVVTINETDNTCVRQPMDNHMKSVFFQCLPPTSVPGLDSLIVGLGSKTVDLQGWQVDFPGVGRLRVALTNATPAVPVLREFKDAGAKVGDVALFFNANTTVSEPGVFVVPATCPPPTVVG